MSAPSLVDIHVGNRIRLIRVLRGLSQGKLAEALGITFQQVQKYERGLNRIGAGRLYEIARVLEIPVGFFFDDLCTFSAGLEPVLRDEVKPLRPPLRQGSQEAQNDILVDAKLLTRAETLKLVKAYYCVQNVATRRQILQLLKNLADQDI